MVNHESVSKIIFFYAATQTLENGSYAKCCYLKVTYALRIKVLSEETSHNIITSTYHYFNTIHKTTIQIKDDTYHSASK